MRRLLLRQRLYGTKVGFVWTIFPDDLEAFKRMRRPPGRPRKAIVNANKASLANIADERTRAGTGRLLRQRGSRPSKQKPRRNRYR